MSISILLRHVYNYSIDIRNLKVIVNIPDKNINGICFGDSFFYDCNYRKLEYNLKFGIGDDFLEENNYIQDNSQFNKFYLRDKLFLKGIKLENNECSSASKNYWIVFNTGIEYMTYKLLNKIPTITI